MERTADIAIVGAGIVGLAHAYMALKKGFRVVIFERDEIAVGASVRNFGLLWPIGQEPGECFARAMRSRRHWDEVCGQAGIWISANGSLHLAYKEDELAVLHEFESMNRGEGYRCGLLSANAVRKVSPPVNGTGLLGGLYSTTEATVYSREAVRKIPMWLEDAFGAILRFGHPVLEIDLPVVRSARELWRVDNVFVCSGADFETLYPEAFDAQEVTKCKLQMMKAAASAPVALGPSLCAGLTLRHYPSFAKCPSLRKVDLRYDRQCIDYKKHGVHVLVAQNGLGELIIGDSHHYGNTPEPFNSTEVDDLIIRYFNSFVQLGSYRITERWNGVYPKIKNGTHLVVKPADGVTVVTCLGGAGMTLSFGLAEELVDAL